MSSALATAAIALGLAGAAAAEPAPLSVGDLLRFAAFGDPNGLDSLGGSYRAVPPGSEPGPVSPDGAHAAVIVRGGDPQLQANTATLLIYATSDLMHGAKPVKLAELSSTGLGQPIAFVRWMPDGETLTFAGTEGNGMPQVYSANIRTRTVQKLSAITRELVWYAISDSGGRLVTLEVVARSRAEDDAQCRLHGCRVTAPSLYIFEAGRSLWRVAGHIHDLAGGLSRPLVDPEDIDPQLDTCDRTFSGGISPDGRHGIRGCIVRNEHLPEEWLQYTAGVHTDGCVRTRNPLCWRRGYLVDLDTGRPLTWTDAPQLPSFYSVPPLWIDGGRYLVIPAAYESLADTRGDERAKRMATFSVQLVEPATRRMRRIGWLPPETARVTQARWDAVSQMLTVQRMDRGRRPLAPVSFQRNGDHWSSVAAAPARGSTHPTARLVVEQSADEPPKLVAIDAGTGQRKYVLDPNPWLADRQLGKVELIHWPTRNGRVIHGGLYYPPGYVPGRRYPLLIQTHGFDPELFLPHGRARGFPGRALAAHGLFVLQVDENQGEVYSSPRMWDDARAIYEGALDHLDARALIDRNRVGTIGWSASGPMTATMFTHSDYPIAAAAFTDTGVWGWWYNMMQGDIAYDSRFGSAGTGPGLAAWLETSPTFNLARMRTPLLVCSAEGLHAGWEWYAGLRSLDKPVELWVLPTGTHDVYQASQRLKSNQLLVDWFVFWLKGEERHGIVPWGGETAESLADQYARWRKLREQQWEVMKHPRPPLLKWTATPVR